jgi:hypothetical protein
MLVLEIQRLPMPLYKQQQAKSVQSQELNQPRRQLRWFLERLVSGPRRTL